MRAEDEPDTLKREVVTGVFYYAAVLMAALRILPVRPSVRPSVAVSYTHLTLPTNREV